MAFFFSCYNRITISFNMATTVCLKPWQTSACSKSRLRIHGCFKLQDRLHIVKFSIHMWHYLQKCSPVVVFLLQVAVTRKLQDWIHKLRFQWAQHDISKTTGINTVSFKSTHSTCCFHENDFSLQMPMCTWSEASWKNGYKGQDEPWVRHKQLDLLFNLYSLTHMATHLIISLCKIRMTWSEIL